MWSKCHKCQITNHSLEKPHRFCWCKLCVLKTYPVTGYLYLPDGKTMVDCVYLCTWDVMATRKIVHLCVCNSDQIPKAHIKVLCWTLFKFTTESRAFTIICSINNDSFCFAREDFGVDEIASYCDAVLITERSRNILGPFKGGRAIVYA